MHAYLKNSIKKKLGFIAELFMKQWNCVWNIQYSVCIIPDTVVNWWKYTFWSFYLSDIFVFPEMSFSQQFLLGVQERWTEYRKNAGTMCLESVCSFLLFICELSVNKHRRPAWDFYRVPSITAFQVPDNIGILITRGSIKKVWVIDCIEDWEEENNPTKPFVQQAQNASFSPRLG